MMKESLVANSFDFGKLEQWSTIVYVWKPLKEAGSILAARVVALTPAYISCEINGEPNWVKFDRTTGLLASDGPKDSFLVNMEHGGDFRVLRAPLEEALRTALENSDLDLQMRELFGWALQP